MTITKVLKVFAIVLMAVVLLLLASWVGTFWGIAIDSLGKLLPAGEEPIATALRGWLPTIRSAGTVIVLVVACILGLGLGRRIWAL